MFYEHPPFDLRRDVVIDSLHCLYLGVTLALLNLWFGKDNCGEVFTLEIRFVAQRVSY